MTFSIILSLLIFQSLARTHDIEKFPQDLMDEVKSALSVGDSDSLFKLIGPRKGQVYDLALRLSLEGIREALAGDSESANVFFDEAITLARAFKTLFKEETLLSLIKRYRDLTLEEKRKKVSADSIAREAEDLQRKAEYEKSLEKSHKALEIYQSVGDPKGEAHAYRLIGGAMSNLGMYESALEHLRRALLISQKIKDIRGEGEQLSSLGLVYYKLGEYKKALNCYYKSLSIFQELGDDVGEAIVLTNLGVLYYNLGQHAQALRYYHRSLKKQERRGYVFGKIIDLVNIGCAYALDPMRIDSAINYVKLSIPLAKKHGFKLYEGIAYLNLGSLFTRKERYSEALDALRKGLKIFEDYGAKYFEASAHLNVGFALVQLGNLKGGEKHYLKALSTFSDLNYPLQLIETLEHLGWIRELSGKREEALQYYKSAIEILEETRGTIGIEELKSSFVEFKIDVYEEAIRLLYELHSEYPEKGYDRLAFLYSESSKSRSFLDYLLESSRKTKGERDTSRREYEKLARKISSIQFKLLSESISREKRKKWEEELRECKETLRRLKVGKNGRTLKWVISYPLTLQKIVENLIDEKTVLLEFFLGHERAFLWVISSGGLKFLDLGDTRDIETKLAFFRNFIRDRENNEDALHLSHHLFEDLIAPVFNEINDAENLIIVPDGQLFYLPFEALVTRFTREPQGSRTIPLDTIPFLIRIVPVTYAPSASILINLARYHKEREPAPFDLIAFGDPVTGSECKTHRKREGLKVQMEAEALYPPYFERLMYSGIEAYSISRIFPGGKTRLLLREEAKEEEVKKPEISQYKILHFAAHGILNEVEPSGSGILLTQDEEPTEDGFLGLREVLELNLNSELVVLSACRTGLGRYVRGEGILGLSRAFMYAGAPSVVVSLWEVDDRSTSLLMQEFYKNLQKGESKSRALRDAKLSLLLSKDPEFKHPYYWASFILTGDGSSSISLSKRNALHPLLIMLIVGGGIVFLLILGTALRGSSR